MMNSLTKDADGAVRSQAFGPLLYDDIKTSCNRRGINRSALETGVLCGTTQL